METGVFTSDLAYSAGVLVAAVLFVMGVIALRKQREKADLKKGANARAERARMTYDDFAKEYRKAFDTLEKKGYCVLDVIHDLSDDYQAKDGARQFISYEEAFYLCEKIRRSKKSPLLLILHTLGGYSFPSEMIANAIKKHPGKKAAVVPYIAMSGGTVIALATDQIKMGKDAFLGPIDTQYRGYPAVAFDLLKKDKHPDNISDEVLLTSYLVDQHKLTAKKRAMDIINDAHKPKDRPDHVVEELMNAGRHHAEQISAAMAKEMKINVSTEVPPEVYALVDARLGMLRTYPHRNGGSVPPPADPAPETVFPRPERLRAPDMRVIDALGNSPDSAP